MAKWTEEQKIKALAIAATSSASEASKQTGIPRGTILTWMRNQNQSINQSQSIKAPKKIEKLAEEAIEQAKVEVREYVVDRVKQVSDGILELVELAKDEAINLIRSGHDPQDSKAQWLRSVVGAIAQGVEKHQLLEGKPTQRSEVKSEVTQRNEQHYHVIQELVNTDDEVGQRLIERLRRSQSIPGSS